MVAAIADDEFGAFLSRSEPAVQALARATRALVLDIFPDAVVTAGGRDLGLASTRDTKAWSSPSARPRPA